ncbi:M16 family metallopeptidase [Ferruginibacter yonginensis]|uniref:M16 family metallopeptidase n=1 Tax=Ferruginibacter yonginensis TaxID=1310416 RepID=A0ABV8QR21_9BACT
MKKYLFATAAFCFAVSAGFSQAKLIETVTKKGDELVIPYQKYVLPNGLTVVLAEDHSDPLVHVDVTYHVGSAREEIGKSGFAHFFEHMMFQGSDNVGDEQHFKIISGSGGTLNGSTNQDRTNYYETVPSNQLEKMLWLESDRMGFLLDAVTQQKFEIQRSTVKNERGQNYDNRPYGLAGEFASKNLYPYGHPYSWLTIGYVEDLNRVNVNDLKNFFLRWYGPNNATITIGGDFKSADVIKLVDKYFGSIPRGPEVTKTVLAPVVLESDRYASYTDNYAKIPLLTKSYVTVPNYDKDMAALACLAQVIGQGKNSILYQNLVKTQKALNASCNSRLSELAGEFSFQIVPLPGKSLAAMDSLLTEALVAFEKRGVTDEDIIKFKGGIESQFINGLQSVSGKVSQLAAFQTYVGNPNMIGKQLEMYRAVTKEDVMNAYNKYIKGKHSLTVSVLVKGQNAAPVMADNYTVDTTKYVRPNYGYDGLKYVKAKDNFDRSKQPGVGANPVVKVPAFTKKSTPNGIKMIFAESKELPIVNISIRIPGGQIAETDMPAKSGIAGMTASMMNEDTKNYTAEQMAVELQKLGSNINISSSFDGTVFSVQSLKKNLDKTLALLEERMLNPKFTEATFSRLQKQALEGFKQLKSQPAAIADNVFDKINYSNSILGLSSNGTETTIKSLTLKDVEDFYANNMTTQGARVVVVGDVKEADVLPKLAFLNKIPNKKIAYAKPAAAPLVNKTTIYIVDVPKAAQTEFRVGGPTNLKYDATGEYYKLGLVNFTIGGDFNSRLNINLREDKGWTYGARSSFSSNDYAGDYTFSAGIRADATDSALTEVIKEIKNYAANGITAEELSFMKMAIGQRDALAYETGGQKAGFVGRILQYDLPATYVNTQSNILKNMTKTEIDALAKKWLDINKVNILLVGDKAKILPGLQKFGYEIVELDVDGNKK